MGTNHLAAYQRQALATAAPVALTLPYLIPAIVGEVGELFGQQAKALWHGWSREKLQEELALEYGDICWMTAALLSRYDVDEVPQERYDAQRWLGGTVEPWWILLRHSSSLYNWYVDKATHSYLEGTAKDLWVDLERNAHLITGHYFEVILQMNLDKLKSRAERGVLMGKGDHR